MKVLVVLGVVTIFALGIQGLSLRPEARKYISPSARPIGTNTTTGTNGTNTNTTNPGNPTTNPNSTSTTAAAPESLPDNILLYFLNTPRTEHQSPPLTISPSLKSMAQQCADFYQIGKQVTENTKDAAKLAAIDPCYDYVDMGTAADYWYVGGCDSNSQVTMIQDWVKERDGYDFDNPDMSKSTEFQDFTQLVWKETANVGCAISKKPIKAAAGGSNSTTPAAGGSNSTTPAAGGSNSTTPAAGGSNSTTPAAGGSNSTTPAAGGSNSTTPAAGGSSTAAAAEQCIHVCVFDKPGNIQVNNRNTFYKTNVLKKK